MIFDSWIMSNREWWVIERNGVRSLCTPEEFHRELKEAKMKYPYEFRATSTGYTFTFNV